MLDTFSCDELIVAEVLSCSGRDIRQAVVKLPSNRDERRNKFLDLCVYYMKLKDLEFGKKPEHYEISITSFTADAIFKYLSEGLNNLTVNL